MNAQQELTNVVGPMIRAATVSKTIAQLLAKKAIIATEMALQTTPLAGDPVLLEAVQTAKKWTSDTASAEQVDEVLAKLEKAGSYAEDANLTVITVQDLLLRQGN